MKDIYFINAWPKLESAWSGTPMGLYTALSKHMKLHLLNGCTYTGRVRDVLNILTMGLPLMNSIVRLIDRTDIPDHTPILAFGEYSSRHVKDTYCFQDLSVDYLLRLRKSNHPAASSAFKNIVPTFIAERKNRRAKEFYKNCAGVFTMSQWLREDLIHNTGLPAEKVHHVGGGSNIDVSKIDYSRKEGDKFLFVGKTWELKNGELVVEAFKKLAAAHPDKNLKLYIAGPENKPASLEGCENIVFLGRLSYAELIEYYNLCDYFVMPSKHDAYGLVFVEALCFGLPCIGKNLCAMPEFIQPGKNGYLIDHDDAQELAEMMEKLLLNGAEMAATVQSDREYYLKQYSWDSVADRIMDVLKRDGYVD